eukprot:365353-Chlamydomonas_euryale.AAC.11
MCVCGAHQGSDVASPASTVRQPCPDPGARHAAWYALALAPGDIRAGSCNNDSRGAGPAVNNEPDTDTRRSATPVHAEARSDPGRDTRHRLSITTAPVASWAGAGSSRTQPRSTAPDIVDARARMMVDRAGPPGTLRGDGSRWLGGLPSVPGP